MRTSDQVKEIKKFIEGELSKGIVCATKTAKDERIELIYFNPLGGCYKVRKGKKVKTFYTLEEACYYFDSIN